MKKYECVIDGSKNTVEAVQWCDVDSHPNVEIVENTSDKYGSYECSMCGFQMNDHGKFINAPVNRLTSPISNQRICPSIWIITFKNGDVSLLNDRDFNNYYSEVK